MISLSTLAISFIISIAVGVFFHYKWRILNNANSAYINRVFGQDLIKPENVKDIVGKYGSQIAVIFDNIPQTQSGFLVHRKTLRFPIDGISVILFEHEMGHVKSLLGKKHRWIHLASKFMFLRRISIAIGTDYTFEKEAWDYSGFLGTNYASNSLKAYRYVQVVGIFDLLSKFILAAIIIGLIF